MIDDMRQHKKHASVVPVIVAIVIVVLLAVILIGLILFLRPAYDPLLVITGVTGMFSAFAASVLAYMKAQETHLSVNSQLDSWKSEFSRMIKAETTIAATANEQDRVALLPQVLPVFQAPAQPAVFTAPIAVAAPVSDPVKVEIVSPDPLPVEVTKGKK